MSNTVVRRAALFGIAAGGLAALGLFSPWVSRASGSEVFTGLVSGTGAGGYDVVAYARMGRPVEGEGQITHAWNGAIWRFASVANRDAFAADPEQIGRAHV